MAQRTQFLIGPAILLSHSLIRPRPYKRTDGTTQERYSVLLGFDKDNKKQVQAYEAFRAKARELAAGEWPGVPAHVAHFPGKDGDEADAIAVARGDPSKAYRRGRYLVSLSTDANPQYGPPKVTVYPSTPLTDPALLYKGCLVYVSGSLATYNTKGNMGVAAYLSEVLWYAPGVHLQSEASNPFDGLPPPDDESPF